MSVMDKLKSIGISLKPYRRGPIGKQSFAMDLDGKHLRIWEGEATISISTNKRKKQAVLTVHEKPRKISSTVNLSTWSPKFVKQWCDVADDEVKNIIEDTYTTSQIRQTVALQVPNSRMKVIKVQKQEGTSYQAKVTVEFSAPSTTTSFLVGFDTHATRPFISQLRNVVGTVQEAHNELLPRQSLAVGHKRQGEWFFNPVGKTLATQLTKNITKGIEGPIDGRGWATTTHRGFYLRHNKKRYVIGMISDTRKGRHPPLFLPAWHEIVRNNEVVATTNNQRWD